MRNPRSSRTFTALAYVTALVAALVTGASFSSVADAALATGSVTARAFHCPERLTLEQVRSAQDPGTLLDTCEPFASGAELRRLRSAHGGTPAPFELLAPGVFHWPHLEFGGYALGATQPPGFGDVLLTSPDGTPFAAPPPALLDVGHGSLAIERRVYLFVE